MAKEHNLHPVFLFGISAALLSAGWLMKSFPVFIFAGLAPLFAITDRARNKEHVWNLTELILMALAIGFLAAYVFEMQFLVMSLVEAIALTLAFLGYSFAYQRLGGWTGKFTIIFFWLAIEYVFLKLPWRHQFIYLGDALALKTDWLKWTQYTGYLGSSLWILIANLFLYITLFRDGKINWVFLVITLLWITVPIGFSYWREGQFISRTEMISLYDHKISTQNENYIRLGEVISSTAAGISVLILLFAVIRNKDRQ